MQAYKITQITRDQIVPIAERMKKEGRYLVMIHGYVDKDGQIVVSWNYAVDPDVESYQLVGEWKLPSISDIYDVAASWPERELNELFGLEFEGLDATRRLFLPEDMLEMQGKGQIMVTPLCELVDNMNRTKEEQ